MSHSFGFSHDELQQYKLHLSLDLVGLSGQKKLKDARVLCVGAGGLGNPLLLYLAGAGIGTLGIIDNDRIELSNLQRQILFTTNDVGKNKVVVAKDRLSALNPHINLKIYENRLTTQNARDVFSQYDIIADGSDNFETRYLVNHTCLALQKVNVSASVSEFKGQCTVLVPYQGPCYNCLFPSNQGEEFLLNCRERGILGVLPGLLGTIQATEVIKWILGIGTPLVGKLLQIDALTMDYKIYFFKRNPHCCLCSKKDLPSFSYKKTPACQSGGSITPNELRELIKEGKVFLIDVREPLEHTQYSLGGVNIPLHQLPEKLDLVLKDKLIIVYCQSGQRSLQAMRILRQFGFLKVRNLEGGIQAWLERKASG
jgi:adenylyltransferase/sulfurtransferase